MSSRTYSVPNMEETRPSDSREPVPVADLLGAGFAARPLAIAAGDQRVAIMNEVRRVLDSCQRNPFEAARVGLDRLTADRLISGRERSALEQICGQVFAAQRGKSNPAEAFANVRTIYEQLLIDSSASPVALAIASLAASGGTAAPAAPPGTALALSSSNQVDLGMVGGAIAGAVVGGAIGGAGGAVIGAVVGGIAAGVATACAT